MCSFLGLLASLSGTYLAVIKDIIWELETEIAPEGHKLVQDSTAQKGHLLPYVLNGNIHVVFVVPRGMATYVIKLLGGP